MRTIALFQSACIPERWLLQSLFKLMLQWSNVMTTPVVQGLAAPVHINNAGDGSARLFIVEQAGRIRIFNNGTLQSTPISGYLTTRPVLGEQGLLSCGISPEQ